MACKRIYPPLDLICSRMILLTYAYFTLQLVRNNLNTGQRLCFIRDAQKMGLL